MALTIREFPDLIRVLQHHPEWREELRRQVLTDELLSLPQIVRELAEAQVRTEQRLGALAERVDALAEAQRETQEQLRTLTARVEALAEAQGHTEDRLSNLIGEVRGARLEDIYRKNPYRFQSLLRRPAILARDEVFGLIQPAVEAGRLSETDAYDLGEADLFVRGFHKREDRPLWLVVEVSHTVDTDDVEKAVRRAGLLAEALREAAPQPQVLPVVAGEAWTPLANTAVRQGRVTLIHDGKTVRPE